MRNKQDLNWGEIPFPSVECLLPCPIPSPLSAHHTSASWWDNGHHRERWSLCGFPFSFPAPYFPTQMLWWGSSMGHSPHRAVPAPETLLTAAPASHFPLPLLCPGLVSSCFFYFSPALVSLLPLLVPCQLWHLSFSGISSCLVAATFLKYVFLQRHHMLLSLVCS